MAILTIIFLIGFIVSPGLLTLVSGYALIKLGVALLAGKQSAKGVISGIVASIAYVGAALLTISIIAIVIGTASMKTGGASGIPIILAMFYGFPALGVLWIVIALCLRDDDSAFSFACKKCDSKTNINWGDAKGILCEMCFQKSLKEKKPEKVGEQELGGQD